jgi:dihydroxyacetone kinase
MKSTPIPPHLSVTLSAAQGRKLLAALPDASKGLVYICIGANCWGQALNAKLAAERARSEGSAGEYIIHAVGNGAEVDQVNGTLYYNSKVAGTQVGIARFKQS